MAERGVIVTENTGVQNPEQYRRMLRLRATLGSRITKFSGDVEFDSRVRPNRWTKLWGMGRFSVNAFLEQVVTEFNESGLKQTVKMSSDITIEAQDEASPVEQEGSSGDPGADAPPDQTEEEAAAAAAEAESEAVFAIATDEGTRTQFMHAQSAAAGKEGVFIGEYVPPDERTEE